jgi:alpha-1,3-rhamnosyl/mannosyltransferase
MVISVCVDVSPVRSRLTGIGHYTLEVVRALNGLTFSQERGGDDRTHIDIDGFDGFRCQSVAEFLDLTGHREEGRAFSFRDRVERHFGARARAVVDTYGGAVARRYQRLRRRGLYDLFHATNFFAPVPLGRAVVPVIHDLSVMRHPDYHPRERVRWFERHIRSALSAPRVLTVSVFSAQEITALIGIPPERIRVAYPGVDQRFFAPATPEDATILSRFGVAPRSYALSVSTLEPRKNLRTLVDAYGRLPANIRSEMPLLLVGDEGWGELRWPEATESLVRAGQIRFTGYVDDIVLRTLYRGAAGFFYPSLYEGYGMPVTEALACGASVVVASGGAPEEAAMGQGLMVHPLDTEAWTRAFERIFEEAAHEDDAAREVRRGAAATRTWNMTARVTYETYVEAASSG